MRQRARCPQPRLRQLVIVNLEFPSLAAPVQPTNGTCAYVVCTFAQTSALYVAPTGAHFPNVIPMGSAELVSSLTISPRTTTTPWTTLQMNALRTSVYGDVNYAATLQAQNQSTSA